MTVKRLIALFLCLAAPLAAAAQSISPTPEQALQLPSAPAALDVLYVPAEENGTLSEPPLLAAPLEAESAPRTGGVVILYGPFGAGHESAAKAIKKAYEKRGQSAHLIDVTTHLSPRQAAWVKKGYQLLQTHWPKGLELVYDIGEKLMTWTWTANMKRRLDERGSKALVDDLVARKPDVIVSTYLPSRAVEAARRDGRLTARYGVVITDWRSHRAWVDAEPDRFYVAGGTDEPASAGSRRMADEVAAQGVPRERIVASGIPVDPDLASVVPEKLSDKPSVLIMGGGFGAWGLVSAVKGFRGAANVHLEIVAGKNPKTREKLERLVRKLGLDATVHGFVPHDKLMGKMAGSDLVVTKPGGLTVTEAQALGKPLVLIGPAYAQEKGNASIVVESGAGIMAVGREAGRRALYLANRPDELRRMGRASRRLANIRAADEIVDDLSR